MSVGHYCWEIEICVLYEIYDPPCCMVQYLSLLCRHHTTTTLTKIPVILRPRSAKVPTTSTIIQPSNKIRKYINMKIKRNLNTKKGDTFSAPPCANINKY